MSDLFIRKRKEWIDRRQVFRNMACLYGPALFVIKAPFFPDPYPNFPYLRQIFLRIVQYAYLKKAYMLWEIQQERSVLYV